MTMVGIVAGFGVAILAAVLVIAFIMVANVIIRFW